MSSIQSRMHSIILRVPAISRPPPNIGSGYSKVNQNTDREILDAKIKHPVCRKLHIEIRGSIVIRGYDKGRNKLVT
jgi:hypothetical protein